MILTPPKSLEKEEGENSVVLTCRMAALGCCTSRNVKHRFPEQKANFSLAIPKFPKPHSTSKCHWQERLLQLCCASQAVLRPGSSTH